MLYWWPHWNDHRADPGGGWAFWIGDHGAHGQTRISALLSYIKWQIVGSSWAQMWYSFQRRNQPRHQYERGQVFDTHWTTWTDEQREAYRRQGVEDALQHKTVDICSLWPMEWTRILDEHLHPSRWMNELNG